MQSTATEFKQKGRLLSVYSECIEEVTPKFNGNLSMVYFRHNQLLSSKFKIALLLARPYIFHFLISFLWIIICITLQLLSIIYSDSLYDPNTPPLSDRVHSLVGQTVDWAYEYVNLSVRLFLITTLVRFGLFIPFRMTCLLLTRTLYITGILYLIRSFAIIVTTLPNPIYCKPIVTANAFETFHLVFSILKGEALQCTDLIISGHTIVTTILLMSWVHYNRKHILAIIFALLFAFWNYTLIDISFYHYTIDIFNGIFFTITIYTFYHLLIDLAAYRLKGRNNPHTNSDFLSMIKRRFRIGVNLSKFLSYIEGLDYHFKLHIIQECYMTNKKKFAEDFIPEIPTSNFLSKVTFWSSKNRYSLSADMELFNSLLENHPLANDNFDSFYKYDGSFDFYIFKKIFKM